MISSSVAGIVFANTYDETVEHLTEKRSISSIPFGSRYRLIDFCLSNLVNAGVSNVGIITREKYRSLMDHIGSGMHWDLDRKSGGIRILPPFNIGNSRLYRGYVEALYGAMDFMLKCNTKYIVLCDARSVSNVDVNAVVKYHKEKDADITVVCNSGLNCDNNKHTMTLNVSGDGQIKGTAFPQSINADDLYGMNMYVFNREKLIELVKTHYEDGAETVSADIISANVNDLKIMAYVHNGYTAIIDSFKAYQTASFDLLDADVRKNLFIKDRPVYTKTRDDMPTRYGTQSSVKNSLVAEGCVIEGTVENSLLFRGVKVEKGAVVKNCILMQSVTVGANTQLENVVSDKNAVVSEGMVIKGTDEQSFFIAKDQTI